MILMERSAVFGSGQLNRALLLKHFLFISLLCVATVSVAAVESQPDEPSAGFRKLQTCVSKANKKFGDDKSETGKLADEIKKDANILISKWMNASNQMVPDDYLRTLSVNCELLEKATAESDTDQAKLLLQDVADDLEVKATQARNQVGASEALGASIKVIVKTRRNGREVDGYLVLCNPKRYERLSPALFPFNNPTNQAERILPPGNYIVWLETPDHQFVASRPITVGGSGASSQPPIWFDVP